MRPPVAVLLGSALVAGCATTPPPPAATTYIAQNCASAPDLGTAASLTPESRRRIFRVGSPVDASTPCFRNGEAPTPYVVYALPSAVEGTMIEVGAELEGARIFSPAISILDEDGRPLRSFEPGHYLYRGVMFSVQFLPQPGERFILITADPTRIGRNYDAVAISTSTTAIVTPYAAASWTSGVDRSISRTFSYDGAVAAIVYSPEGNER